MRDITETRLSYIECKRIYGTSDIHELNLRFEQEAQIATAGNCSKWAIYANGEILICVEC